MHALSTESSKYFQRAIVASGTAATIWATSDEYDHSEVLYKLAADLGQPQTTVDGLINFLNTAPAEKLIPLSVQSAWFFNTINFKFAPVIERKLAPKIFPTIHFLVIEFKRKHTFYKLQIFSILTKRTQFEIAGKDAKRPFLISEPLDAYKDSTIETDILFSSTRDVCGVREREFSFQFFTIYILFSIAIRKWPHFTLPMRFLIQRS